MSFPIEAVKIDFNEEILYGHDQANITYPTVFPTVTFQLESTPGLIDQLSAEKDFDPDVNIEFFVGINGFTKTRLDYCIQALYQDDTWTIDLDEEMQKQVFDALNTQCEEHLGKTCEKLLEEAKAQI